MNRRRRNQNHNCPLIYQENDQNVDEFSHLMKNFHNIDIPYEEELSDILDILQRGEVEELYKYICTVLNFNPTGPLDVVDFSFVKCFLSAQVIIRFLLYVNYERQRNTDKLGFGCQEYYSEKQKIKRLQKQLLMHQNSSDESKHSIVSDLFKMQKTSNSSHPFIHLPRQAARTINIISRINNETLCSQAKLSFPNKILQQPAEIFADSLKSKIKSTDIPLKMKLIPEIACLEAQEKYWRGRLKEISEGYEKFKTELQSENAFLKKRIENIENNVTKCSIAVQTEISNFSIGSSTESFGLKSIENISLNLALVEVENQTRGLPNDSEITPSLTAEGFVIQDFLENNSNNHEFLSPSLIVNSKDSTAPFENSNKFDLKLLNASIFNSPLAESKITKKSSEKEDILKEVDSFLKNYEHKKQKLGRNTARQSIAAPEEPGSENVKRTITKLFTNESNSVHLADKLIKIYEKRHSLLSEKLTEKIPKVESKTDENTFNLIVEKLEGVTDDSVAKCDDHVVETNCVTVDEESLNKANFDKHIRDGVTSPRIKKFKFLPFFQNISSKILKINIKTGRTGTNGRKTNSFPTVSSVYSQSSSANGKSASECEEDYLNVLENAVSKNENNDENVDGSLSKRNGTAHDGDKLVSALKKSKSTDHMNRKVAFTDDLPAFKTSLEGDLRKKEQVSSNSSQSHSLESVGVVQVHFDQFNKPVPAPRSKKNIFLAKETLCLPAAVCELKN